MHCVEPCGTDKLGVPDDANYELTDEFRVNVEVGRKLLSEIVYSGIVKIFQ